MSSIEDRLNAVIRSGGTSATAPVQTTKKAASNSISDRLDKVIASGRGQASVYQAPATTTKTGTSRILGPLTAGIIMGYVYAILMKASAYTGGTDFISAIIHKRHPDRPFFGMNFSINSAIAVASYFVYGCQMEPVILCILYCFMTTTVGDRLMKSGREAICFEIITNFPQEVSRELIDRLHHTATFIPAKGMYSGRDTSVLLCVVNKTQVALVSQIVHKYPHTFAIVHPVSEILGNFKNLSSSGKEVVEVLDAGDRKTL